MKEILFATLAAAAIALNSCGKHAASDSDLPTFDVAGAINVDDPDMLAITDVEYISLDTVTNALLGGRAEIKGFDGNRIVVLDGMDRLLVFNTGTGQCESVISHKGNGPGEYTWIEWTAIDTEKHQIIVTDPTGSMGRYTLDDSLIESLRFTPKKGGGAIAKGTVASGYYATEDNDGDLLILHYPIDFSTADTTVVKNFKMGFLAGSWSQHGEMTLLTLSDTIFRITPDGLEKWGFYDNGSKGFNPEVEAHMMELRQDHQAMRDFQSQHISTQALTVDDRLLSVAVFYDNKTYLLFFDRRDGSLLKRIEIGYDKETMPGLQLEYDSMQFGAYNMFYNEANGRYYSVVGEQWTPEGRRGEESNSGLISFRLAPKE